MTTCSTCGTRTAGGSGIDPSSLRKLVGDEIRKYLASMAPDATVARSPLAEGGGSGGEGCEAQGRSEGLSLDSDAIRARAAAMSNWGATEKDFTVRELCHDRDTLLAVIRLLESEVDRRARSVIAANGRTERVEAALVRNRETLNRLAAERDEARTALAVARAQAESEAVARAEAEAELAALPEKIAAKIEEHLNWGWSTPYSNGLTNAARIARSFTPAAEPSNPEPVPEPVREWGVRHGKDCRWGARVEDGFKSKEGAAKDAARTWCTSSVVSRVPGGEWEEAE